MDRSSLSEHTSLTHGLYNGNYGSCNSVINENTTRRRHFESLISSKPINRSSDDSSSRVKEQKCRERSALTSNFRPSFQIIRLSKEPEEVKEKKDQCQQLVYQNDVIIRTTDSVLAEPKVNWTSGDAEDPNFDNKFENSVIQINLFNECLNVKTDDVKRQWFLKVINETFVGDFTLDALNMRRHSVSLDIGVTQKNFLPALELQLPKSEEKLSSNTSTNPPFSSSSRISLIDSPSLLILGGINPHEKKSNGFGMWRFSPLLNEWESVGQLPEPRIHAGTAVLLNVVYLIGGCVPSTDTQLIPLPTVWKLSLSSGSWSSSTPLINSRMYHGVVDGDACVYAVGGTGKNGNLLDSIERYDLSSDQWSEIEILSSPRMCVGVGFNNGHLWVCGGFEINPAANSFEISDRVESYCPLKKKWKILPALPNPRCLAAVTLFMNHLCVVGGATNHESPNEQVLLSCSDVDLFDAESNQWIRLAKLDYPRHGAVALVLGSYLHVIGGTSNLEDSNVKTVECFSAKDSAWFADVATLHGPIVGISGVVIPRAKMS